MEKDFKSFKLATILTVLYKNKQIELKSALAVSTKS